MCAPRVTRHTSIWYSSSCHTCVNMGASIFLYIHSHCLVAEMGTTMKNNFLGKKFLSCFFYPYRFHKHVSYGFPIINFCNPGVHYETPCIYKTLTPCSNVTHTLWKDSVLMTSESVNLKEDRPQHTSLRSSAHSRNNCSKYTKKNNFPFNSRTMFDTKVQ
jgi:hypothetical protein